MKKIYSLLLLTLAMFLVSCNQDRFIGAVKVSSETGSTTGGTSGGTVDTSNSNFTINSDGIITGFDDSIYTLTAGDNPKYVEIFEIPNTINAVTVKGLASTAFEKTSLQGNVENVAWKIQRITFPSTLESIGDGVFQNLSIQTLALPNSLKTIGANAFKGAAINNLTIPNTVTAIGTDAFKDVDNWAKYVPKTAQLSVTIIDNGGDTGNLKSLLEASTNIPIVYN